MLTIRDKKARRQKQKQTAKWQKSFHIAITSNVKELKFPDKLHRLAEWIYKN